MLYNKIFYVINIQYIDFSTDKITKSSFNPLNLSLCKGVYVHINYNKEANVCCSQFVTSSQFEIEI